ncbi:hypothetical protein GcM3_101025 [Golovinomyces cichoracearum]|uniref:Uncharacterized protein n=1 Tax=Golovinomyces cichoracearum TaxID=62708 RepID=A0A420IA96_9PEZI|nr:hypothetical protein GcM3_101025 [Golovinomyces cichoracearum]
MHRFCFILLVARSSHNHHPAYPTRLPKDIKEQVQEILRSVDILATSSRCLLVSPVYTKMCCEFGVSRLSILHPSLGAQDRLTALIREERLYQYPAGTDYAAAKRTNTYVNAFINTDTRQAYATMFREVLRALGEVDRFVVQVGHIHQIENALQTITVDMCKKQASGFGNWYTP